MALVPVPGNACAIRLVAAAVVASCGSSAEPPSLAFAGVNARIKFAITAAPIQAATTRSLASQDDLWLSSADTLVMVLTPAPVKDAFTWTWQILRSTAGRIAHGKVLSRVPLIITVAGVLLVANGVGRI